MSTKFSHCQACGELFKVCVCPPPPHLKKLSEVSPELRKAAQDSFEELDFLNQKELDALGDVSGEEYDVARVARAMESYAKQEVQRVFEKISAYEFDASTVGERLVIKLSREELQQVMELP